MTSPIPEQTLPARDATDWAYLAAATLFLLSLSTDSLTKQMRSPLDGFLRRALFTVRRGGSVEEIRAIVAGHYADLFNTILKQIRGERQRMLRLIADRWGMSPKLLSAISGQSLADLRRGTTWVARLRAYTVGAEAEVAAIITDAIQRGVNATVLARALTPYLRGASVLTQIRAGSWQFDATTVPPELRGAARAFQFSARRLAIHELSLARHDASILLAQADPRVATVQWTLSSNRGSARIPDACDMLSALNAYGVGRGVYPVTHIPTLPHPFCKCTIVPKEGKREPVERRAVRSMPFGIENEIRRKTVAAQVLQALDWSNPPSQ